MLEEEKSVVAYAMTEFISDKRQEAEFRATSYNALKIWLNGRLVYERNVYHMGSEMDQYVVPAVLQPGPNVILVKVCQNAKMEDWARWWATRRPDSSPRTGAR